MAFIQCALIEDVYQAALGEFVSWYNCLVTVLKFSYCLYLAQTIETYQMPHSDTQLQTQCHHTCQQLITAENQL